VPGQPGGDIAHARLLHAAGRQLSGRRRIANLDLIARFDLETRDVDLVIVDPHMPVIDELAGSPTSAGKSKQVDDAVQPSLQQLEKTLARDAAFAFGLLEGAPELSLEKSVHKPELLLLHQTDRVLTVLAAGARTVDSRGITPFFKCFAGAENRLA
jgi:hypothetical protein